MFTRHLKGAAFVASLMLAGTAIAQTPPAADYVTKAGASDLFEINSSQIVLQSTQDPKIKAFANKMITDHMKTTATVKAAATKAGMTPPDPALDQPKTDMINALYGANGPARDQLYLQQQGPAHQEALALQQDYAKNGDTPALKGAAAKAVPIVKMHLKMLDGMNKSGGMGAM